MSKKPLSILLLLLLSLQPLFSVPPIDYQKLTNSELLMQFNLELIILQNMKDQEIKSIADLEKQSQNSKESIEIDKKESIIENENLIEQTELSNNSQALMDQHKKALADLNKSIANLKKEITKLEGQKSFWQKATLISVIVILAEALFRSLTL